MGRTTKHDKVVAREISHLKSGQMGHFVYPYLQIESRKE
jgi:hypothetical protein